MNDSGYLKYHDDQLTLQEDLEVLQCGPGILHPDVPEGHGVSPTALSLPSHVEHRAAGPVVPLN